MICSLLTMAPTDVQLVMIDPKMVELAPYRGVPHVRDVVTDMRLAKETLTSLVSEMERRYHLLSGAQCRNLASFNALAIGAMRLPRIVIVVDELADLLAAEKDIEPLLIRLLQKGRAAGIHAILATQRPSVDVVSGLIKANVPARIAFRVSSAVDSRVVLDEAGAERLAGRGDALAKLGDDAIRIQAPWVSEGDVDAVCEYLRGRR